VTKMIPSDIEEPSKPASRPSSRTAAAPFRSRLVVPMGPKFSRASSGKYHLHILFSYSWLYLLLASSASDPRAAPGALPKASLAASFKEKPIRDSEMDNSVIKTEYLASSRGTTLSKTVDSRINNTVQSVDDTDNYKLPRRTVNRIDSSKTVFPEMTFEDALNYLQLHSGNNDTVHFLHCVSRHHVDPKARTNFYDLYFLQKPGHPKSDGVWSRNNRFDYKKQGAFPGRLMQLSLSGLVMDDDTTSDPVSIEGTFIPLDQFLHEKEVTERLLEMSFFGNFRQCKVFVAWKLYARKRAFNRNLRNLRENSLFTDKPIIELIYKIHCISLDLVAAVDMFAYCGSGLVSASSYIHAQEEKFFGDSASIKTAIVEIGDLITACYKTIIGNDYLGWRIDAIIAHHPYSKAPPEGTDAASVDWERVRGIQRLKAEYKDKIQKVFLVATLMVEFAVGTILRNFWLRFSRAIRGVPIANRNPARNAIGFWMMAEGGESAAAAAPETRAMWTAEKPAREDIDEQTARKGRYLCMSSAFFVGDALLDAGTNLNLRNTSKVRIAVSPSAAELMQSLHLAFGTLGALLSLMPNLRYHPTIWKKEKVVDAFEEGMAEVKVRARYSPWAEIADEYTAQTEAVLVRRERGGGGVLAASVGSNVLFVHIQNTQIFSEMGLHQLAVRSVHEVRHRQIQYMSCLNPFPV
jgi:hypothetical protein